MRIDREAFPAISFQEAFCLSRQTQFPETFLLLEITLTAKLFFLTVVIL
jgi:hypothetical protein